MRRTDKQSADSERLLREAPVCRIGLSGAGLDSTRAQPGAQGGAQAGAQAFGDFPYVVPLHFTWDGEALYLHCAGEGEKLRRLARDERVCVEVDEFSGVIPGSRPCSFSTRYRSLIAFGHAALVEQDEEKRRALAALTLKYAGQEYAGWKFESRELDGVTVIRVRLSSMSVKSSGPA
ncbi:MAG: pyridoxamine 5'-phosphate oxidase family protein [Spirochaetales bacterium]|nr:pyridoxamine 5'-phosphate oxidase family protein [Spirochaetales bacterium]